MCVALNALAAAVDPEPKFDISKDAVVHAEDAAPLAIGTAGSPNTVAAPTRSLFQTDTIAVRLVLRVAWGLRAAGAVSFTSAVTW